MSGKKKASRALTVAERAVKILELEPEKRLDRILDLPDAKDVVRSLPPQEFYITMKRTGEDEGLDLLDLAGDEQLLIIQDIDAWIGGRIDPARTFAWFKKLLACGPDKVAQWLRVVDADTFISSLRHFLIVTKPDEGTDPHHLADTLPPYTLDGVYYLHFFSDDYRETVGAILTIFIRLRPDLFFRLMEGMIWETGPEVEEQAGRWREGRLRDLGIPDFDEAVAVYQYLDERTFSALPDKLAPVLAADYVAPRFPLVLPGKGLLLMEALALIPQGEELDCILTEIAHLANRVIVADSLDFSDPAHLKYAVSRVRAVLSMGLETLAGDDASDAAKLLRKKWLLNIFQVGYGLTLKLSNRVRALAGKGWIAQVPAGKALLGHPLEEILEGLSRQRPMWYTGGPQPYQPFMKLDEIKAASEAMDRIEYMGDLFFNRLELIGLTPDSWKWKSIYPVEITFETALNTALANAAAGRGFEFRPLRKSDLKVFIQNSFREAEKSTAGKKAGRSRFKKEIEKDLISYLASKGTAKNDVERRIRDELVRSAIKFLEEELGRLDPDAIEPRYIQGLVIRR